MVRLPGPFHLSVRRRYLRSGDLTGIPPDDADIHDM
jgi:hypothetical protein